MENIGYPTALYIIVAVIGLPVAIWKPEAGLFAGLTLLGGLELTQAILTRIERLGPYCNLLDLVIVMLIIAVVGIKRQDKEPINLPLRILAILAVLILAFLRSANDYGYEYEILRALRWAITFPILFIIGSLVSLEKQRARNIIIALYVGAIVACLLYFIRVGLVRYEVSETFAELRSCQFLTSAALPLLLAGLCVRKLNIIPCHKWLHLAAISLCCVAIVLSQTRSVYLALAPCLVLVPAVFRAFEQSFTRIAKSLIVLLLAIVAAGLILSILLPSVDILELVTHRFRDMGLHSEGREATFEHEFLDWWTGSLFCGRGLWYIRDIADRVSGYGHLGWLTILAQLGIIGLACYVYTVAKCIWECKIVSRHPLPSTDRFLATTAGAALILDSIMFLMSGSFLGPGVISLTGFLAGLAWRRHQGLLKQATGGLASPHQQLRWEGCSLRGKAAIM